MTGANTYTGNTTVNAGTLQVGSTAVNPTLPGSYVINSNSTLRIEYATTTSAATALTSPTWANYTGAGTLNIAANGVFDYLSTDAALPAGFTGTLKIDGGRVSTPVGGGLGGTTKVIINPNGHLGMWNNTTTFGAGVAFEIAGTGYGEGTYEVALRMSNGGGTSTINGPVLLTGNAAIGAGGTGVINGVISGASSAALTLGPLSGGNLGGTIALGGVNTYEGDTIINAGTLRLDNQFALQKSTLSGSVGSVVLNSTVAANAFTFGGLQGARNLALQNSSAVAIALTVGANNSTTSYSGILSGAGSLIKTGTGTLTLSGVNTYAGSTSVQDGTLHLAYAHNSTLNGLSGAGTLQKSGSGVLRLSTATTSGFTGNLTIQAGTFVTNGLHSLGAGSSLTLQNGSTYAPAVLDQGLAALTLGTMTTPSTPDIATIDLSDTTFTLSATPSISSPVFVPIASYTSSALAGGGVGSLTLFLPRNLQGTLVDDQGDSNTFGVSLTGYNPTVWKGDLSNVWNVADTANWSLDNGATTEAFLDGDLAQFDDTASGSGAVAVSLQTPAFPNSVTFANATRDYTLSGTGSISGAAALIKTNAAVATISLNNVYTGQSFINGGTLRIGHVNALGSTAAGTVVASGAVLDLNGINLAAEPLNISGSGIASSGALINSVATLATTAAPVTLGADATIVANNPLTLTGTIAMSDKLLTLSGNSTMTLSGPVTGTAGLVKNGTGTVAFSSQKTYAGNTTVDAGILDLTGGGGSGGTIRGSVTVNAGATLRLSAADVTGYGTGTDRLDTINLVGGTLTVNTTGNQTLGACTINMTGATINGIEGANMDFFNTGSNVHTYPAATTSVIRGPRVALRQNGGVTFTVEDGAAEVDLDVQSQIYTNGAFTNNNLIKAGAGTMWISGTSSYTGATYVDAGTLQVPAAQSSAGYYLLDTTTLLIKGSPGTSLTTGVLDFDSGAMTVGIGNFGSQTVAANAPVKVTGTIYTGASVTLKVRGYFSGPGTYPLISYPSSYFNGSAPFTLDLPPNVTGTLVDNPTNLTLDLVITSVDSLVWDGDVDGNWDINATTNWVPNVSAPAGTFQQGLVTLLDDTATGSTALTVTTPVSPASLTVNNSTKTYSIGGAAITGTSALVKFGTQPLTLTGNHTYTGGTTVAAGSLVLGNGTLDGTITGSLINNAALTLHATGSVTAPISVSGTGSLTKLGAGSYALTGAQTFTGPTVVSAGTLIVNSLASTSITTSASSTLEFNRIASGTLDASAAPITGSGGVVYSGPNPAIPGIGDFFANDSNTYTGGTVLRNARAQVSNNAALGSGAVTIENGGQLYTPSNVVITNPITISGLGWLEPAGQLGAIRLNGNGTIAGTITLASDSRIGSYGGSGAISGVIAGTGNLEFRSNANTDVINLVGSSPNTYVGTTIVRSGSVILNKTSGAAITGDVIMDNSGVNPVISMQTANQFVGEPLLSFINTGSNGHFCLYGNNLTLRGISSAAGGVVQNSQVVGGAGQTNVPATLTINVPTAESYSFLGGYLRNQVGQLNVVKTGAGTQLVGGSTTIDYNGTTDVKAGVLGFYDMDDIQSRAITISSGATLRIEAVTRTFSGNIFNPATWSGAGNIVMTGVGIKQFNGNADTFLSMDSGTQVDVQQGVLRLGFGSRFFSAANKADLNVGAGATFNLWDTPTANEVRFDALTGSGTVTRGYTPETSTGSTGVGTFVIGVDNGSGTFAGVIADGLTNAGSILNLVKRGTGVQTLSASNTYRGTTRIDKGTLALSGDGDLTASSSITVLPGSLFDVSAKTTIFALTSGRTLTAGRSGAAATDVSGNVVSGGILNVAGWATAGTLSLDGDLTLNAGGALQLDLSGSAASGNDVVAVDGNLLLSGTTTVTPALIGGLPDTANPYTILTYTGALTGDATNFVSGLPAQTRYTATFDTTTVPQAVLMSISGTGESLTWSAASGQTWVASTTPLNWSADTKYFQNLDTVLFDDSTDGTGAVTVNLTSTVQPGAMTFNNPTRAYTVSGTNGVIAGGGALVKRGAAGLTLSNPNTFTGGITLVDGSITLTNASAAGTGVITLSHPDTAAAIVLKANLASGVFANPITVSANGTGTVTIDQDVALSSLTGTLTLNRPTTIEGGPDRTAVAGKITGNVGTLTFTGVRTTLDNTVQSDFTGNIEIANAAVVQTNSMPNCLPSSASVNTSGTGRLQLNNGLPQTINALTGGTAGTTGVQIIAGSATTLTVGAANGSGTFVGNIINSAAALSLTKVGTGTQTLGGTNTFTGTTRVLAGTLALTNASALSGSTLVWNNEGGTIDFGTLTAVNLGNIQGSQDLTTPSSVTDLTIGTGGNGDHCVYSGKITTSGANTTFTKRGVNNLVLSGTSSSAWTGNTRIITESTAPTLQASLHLAKTGGAKAIPSNTVVQFGTGTTNQANLRTDYNEQFGNNVVINFGNAVNNWTRFDLRGTTQTLAGIITGNLTTAGSGVLQGRGLDTVASGESTLNLNGNTTDVNYPVGGYVYNGYLRDADTGVNGLYRVNLVKSGTGTQTLIGANIAFSGAVTVNGGKLNGTKFGSSDNTRNFVINAGGIMEFGAPNTFGGHNSLTVPNIIINGGTLTNADLLGTNNVNNALRNVTLINGTLTAAVGNATSTINPTTRPGEGYGAWGLNGTVTSSGVSSINVGSVTGMAGRILLSSNTADTLFQVTDGTLTVAAPLQSGESAVNYGMTKSGAGKLVLSAANLYTGNTTVNAGTLELADNAQLKFVIGATSGTNNSISGAGTVDLKGDFVIDTTAAAALTTGSWTLENVPSLTGAYGSTFSVVGFADAGNDKWTKVVGDKLWTFNETTGVLTVEQVSYASWINGFYPAVTDPDIVGATADPDKDGIANAVEMVLGGNPLSAMDAALKPTIELVSADPDNDTNFSNYLLFTYRRTDLSVSAGLASDGATSTDLNTWTAATGAPGVVILTDDNYGSFVPAASNTDRVRVYVPRGTETKIFGRLNVTVP